MWDYLARKSLIRRTSLKLPRRGEKKDEGKPRFELLAYEVLRAISRILTKGAVKYASRTWEKGIAYGRVYGAAQWHLADWWNATLEGGDGINHADGNESHLDHAITELMFLSAYEKCGRSANGRVRTVISIISTPSNISKPLLRTRATRRLLTSVRPRKTISLPMHESASEMRLLFNDGQIPMTDKSDSENVSKPGGESVKLIIAGSRTIKPNLMLLDGLMKQFGLSPTEIVSGNAKGVDSTGPFWVEEKRFLGYKVAVKTFKPDWDTHGKAAGPTRNRQMAAYADALLLIWDGQSRGSKNMKEEMQKLNKPVYEVILRQP